MKQKRRFRDVRDVAQAERAHIADKQADAILAFEQSQKDKRKKSAAIEIKFRIKSEIKPEAATGTYIEVAAYTGANNSDIIAPYARTGVNKTRTMQIICAKCGRIQGRCVCFGNRQNHILYGAEKREYIRDMAIHKSADKRDLPKSSVISGQQNKSSIKPVKNNIKPELPAITLSASPVQLAKPQAGHDGLLAARKRNAVLEVQAEMTAKADLTATSLDDKIALRTVKRAKAMSFETMASPSDVTKRVGDRMSAQIDAYDDELDGLF